MASARGAEAERADELRFAMRFLFRHAAEAAVLAKRDHKGPQFIVGDVTAKLAIEGVGRGLK